MDQAYQLAKRHLEEKVQLWDWDEDVELIGVARVAIVPAQ
jgi:hypothetical protein